MYQFDPCPHWEGGRGDGIVELGEQLVEDHEGAVAVPSPVCGDKADLVAWGLERCSFVLKGSSHH